MHHKDNSFIHLTGDVAVKKQLQQLAGSLALTAAMSITAQAGGINYQYTFDGQWVQSYSRDASIYLSISDNGVNRTVTLQAASRDASTGVSNYWVGSIPADAVKVEGVHSVSVYVDTCAYVANYSTGCGIVDVTATSEPGWENFRTLTQTYNTHTWDDLILQQVGHIMDRYTSTNGSVNGVPLSIDNSGPVKTWMSRMGTAKDVVVSVTAAP